MKQLSHLSLLAALLTALLLAGITIADEIHEERQVKLKVMAGDEMVTVDLSGLELGQSQQITTDSGKLITATRDDQGYELDIEGKKIRIGGHGHGGIQVRSGDDEHVVIHERRVHKEVREIRLDDGDTVKIDGPLHLEIGETRELATEKGASATLSRDDEGLLLRVGGEEIRLPSNRRLALFTGHGEGAHVMEWHSEDGTEGHGFQHVIVNCDDGDEDCAKRVQIHTLGGGGMAFADCEDGEENCERSFVFKQLHLDGADLDLENLDLESLDLQGLDLESLGLEDLDLDGDFKVMVLRGENTLQVGEGEHAPRVIILRGDHGELHSEGDAKHRVMVIEVEDESEIGGDESEPR